MQTITFETLQKPFEERIIEAGCIYWNIEKSYFTQSGAVREVTSRKAIIYHLLRKNTEYSYRFFAESLGFKSHQAVMRLIENVEAQKDICRETARDIQRIEQIAEMLNAKIIEVNIKLVSELPVSR